jgi:hypothetical protein
VTISKKGMTATSSHQYIEDLEAIGADVNGSHRRQEGKERSLSCHTGSEWLQCWRQHRLVEVLMLTVQLQRGWEGVHDSKQRGQAERRIVYNPFL